MDISYKGIWGYALASLANTKEVLYVVNRRATYRATRMRLSGIEPWTTWTRADGSA